MTLSSALKSIRLTILAAFLLLGAQMAFAAQSQGTYGLYALSLENGGLAIVKVNRETGQAWYKRGFEWVASRDLSPIPKSQYVFEAVSFKLQGWSLTRMDVTNGHTWILDGVIWKPIKHLPPKPQHLSPQDLKKLQMLREGKL